MRETTLRILALGALALSLSAPPARAEGWFEEMDRDRLVEFADVLRSPRDYVDVPIRLRVYFQSMGTTFNPYFTRFTEELWANFAAWPLNARLYEKRDWQRPFPFFFVKRQERKLVEEIRKTPRVTALELRCVVRDVFRGQPWIEVLEIDRIGVGLTEESVRHIAKGDALFHAGKYKEAARSYERGLSSDQSDAVRADVHRRIADAYFHAGQFQEAKSHYRAALRHAPGSAVLEQGVVASEQAYEAARARARKRPAPEVTVHPAPFHVPATPRENDVDLLIAMLEDPVAVEAAKTAALEELKGRSEAVRAAAAPEPAAPAPAPAEPVVPEAPAPAEPAQPEEETYEPMPDDVRPEDLAGMEEPAVESKTPAEEQGGSAKGVEAMEPAPPGSGASAEETPAAAPSGGTAEPEGSAPPEGGGAMEVEESSGDADSTAAGSGGAPSEGNAEPVEIPAEEPVVEATVEGNFGDPRVVAVGGRRMRLPRLPFYGCDEVTIEELRAIFEEILLNPEA
jgi:tetratricopeptide (TPR) repeat protein